MSKPLKIDPPKFCSCHSRMNWAFVPAVHKFQAEYEIYFWDCPSCGSTLTFIPDKERTSKLIKQEKPS